jgi:choice-of-anchor B domain-containing protein
MLRAYDTMKFFFPLIFCSFFCLNLSSNLCAQTPCESGFAGVYPCNHVDLLFHAGVEQMEGATSNEIWGWTDSLYMKEYVIVGLSNGVRFYDISNPLTPVYLGRLPSHTGNSIWRTFRQNNNMLFVGSEASGHGMQVFDLTRLRNVANPPELFTEDAHYPGFGKCHTLAILEGHPYAYCCGTNSYSGGLHVVDISNPLVPVLAGGFAEDGYIHEAQIVRYNGPDPDYTNRIIAFCYSGNNPIAMTIVDATDPLDMSIISTIGYPGGSYCHQGWLTQDGGYVIMNDETDEMNGLTQYTRTIIIDVHDLDAPVYMGDHMGTTEAIDHNLIITGNLAFQSNYTAGLQIMDLTNIADTTMNMIAYFDHYPFSDDTAFDGEWMSYPYFSSGVIAVSDLHDGFFLVRPNFVNVDANDFCVTGSGYLSLEMIEGFTGPYDIEISGLPQGTILNWEWLDDRHVICEVTNWPQVSAQYDINIHVDGFMHHSVTTLQWSAFAENWYYLDNDNDGFGSGEAVLQCPQSGYTEVNGDCDDSNPTVYPNAPGTFDDIDNNCNSVLDPDEIYFCADITNDGWITVADVLLFGEEYGCTGMCIADFNEDEIVDVQDLIILLADFSEECQD